MLVYSDSFFPPWFSTAQELASQEEKLLLLESSLKATQEQLSEQIAETVRQEQNSRKFQTEVRTLKERVTASAAESSEYKGMLDKLKAELISLKAEHRHTVQENIQLQQVNHKLDIEMDSLQEDVKNRQQQIQKYEEIVKCLREELSQMQHRDKDEQTYIEMLKKKHSDMESEMESLRVKRKGDVQMIKDQENRLMRLEEELSQNREKYSYSCTELLELQAQLKVSLLNLTTTEKQIKHLTTQAEFYEEMLPKLQEDLEHSREQCRKCTKSLETAEQSIHDLKLEICLIQGNHKQTVDKLREKTEEGCAISSELDSLRHCNKKLNEELSEFKMSMEQANAVMETLQHLNKNTEEECQCAVLPGDCLQRAYVLPKCHSVSLCSKRQPSGTHSVKAVR
ncbi:Hypothetical predicted protein [Pelobates cultripes]|uniref:Uncharacterized protein n=1 Tax=Pelobates cultripes TaxID=61616 RepID=A0AAD1S0W7_PELCU|nr:Hypothetical predicted protein [Pelobates cultripes]